MSNNIEISIVQVVLQQAQVEQNLIFTTLSFSCIFVFLHSRNNFSKYTEESRTMYLILHLTLHLTHINTRILHT